MRVLTTAEGDIVTLRDSVNGTLNEIYIYGKSVQNGTPTPDSPVAIESFENAEVRTNGKNLLDIDSWQNYIISDGVYGITRGVISYNGNSFTLTATGNDCYTKWGGTLFPTIKVLKNTKYVLSWKASNNQSGGVYVFNNNTTSRIWNVNNSTTKRLVFTTLDDTEFVSFRFGVSQNGDSITYSDVQLERADNESAYEPYKEPSVLPIPYTLRGLKVASGGNYTDSEGQQWVSDYVHLWKENGVVKGEMVQNIESFLSSQYPNAVLSVNSVTDAYSQFTYFISQGPRFKGTIDSSLNNGLSNIGLGRQAQKGAWIYNSATFVFVVGGRKTLDDAYVIWRNEPMIIIGEIQTPFTTAIPTDQATAMLNALKTYKPTTNVIGSKPCGLSVQYKAQAPGEVELYGSSPLVLPYVGGSALKSLYLTGGEITQDGVPTPDSPKPIKIGGKELRVNDAGVAYVDGQEVVVSGGNMFKNRNLIGGPVTILSNDANGLRVRAIASDFYIGTINYSLGQYAVYASSLIPLNGAHKLYFYSGNDLLIKNFYSLYDADKKSIAINDRGLAFGQIYDANGIIDITNPNAEYIAFRLGNGSVNIGDEFIIRPYVGLAPMGEKFVPYVEPISIPIPLLIGSDTAEITGNNPVSKGVNLWDEEWELGQYSDSGVPFDNNKRIRSKNPIPCKPNTVYVCSIAEAQRLQFFDKNMNHIGNAYADSPMIELKSPSNACYMQFFAWESYGATYKHDICISESNPFTNGLYFPYEAEPQKKGVKVARWGVKVLDGSEFVQLATTKNKHVFHIALEKKINADSQTVVCAYSNMYSATYQGYIFNIEPDMSIASWAWGSGVGITHFAITSVNAFKEYVRNKYNQGDPIVVVYMIHVEQKSILPVTAPLIKPTSVLTSYVSKMDVTYKAKKAEWWKYLVGIDHDIDLTDKNVTLEALVSIISNSNPKSAIVIALPSDAYKKCVSGGGWNGTISAELAKKPLVTLALK